MQIQTIYLIQGNKTAGSQILADKCMTYSITLEKAHLFVDMQFKQKHYYTTKSRMKRHKQEAKETTRSKESLQFAKFEIYEVKANNL